MQILKNDWHDLLGDEFSKEYYLKIRRFLIAEYKTKTVYPDMYDIFNALHFTPYKAVKVVILGQDPYHGPNQAHGLSFSVKPGVQAPPSLVNIFKELHDDLGCYIPNNGHLKKWANEGVLLLNASLTVRHGQANSHSTIGWEVFTDQVIRCLNDREDPIVFILWGKNAQSKLSIITHPRHCILTSVHPSPLSAHAGFFGSKPFSKANQFLVSIGKELVDWQIENISLSSSSIT
ncbi:MAG: Uracil-DNA glycosylase [Candidatus Dichloromethanomonas elyunquensis]|nr:MAG: Uracil-DNA glycosylase [Candidatus Dichloromethanomonas elyunquensis]